MSGPNLKMSWQNPNLTEDGFPPALGKCAHLPPGVEREGRAGGGGHDGPLAEGRGEEPRGGGAGGGGGGALSLLLLHRPPLLSPGRQDQDRIPQVMCHQLHPSLSLTTLPFQRLPQVNSRLSAQGENWTDQKLKFGYLIFNP